MKYKPGDKVFVNRRGEWVAGVYEMNIHPAGVNGRHWIRVNLPGLTTLVTDDSDIIDRSDLPENERWYRCDECAPGCEGRSGGLLRWDEHCPLSHHSSNSTPTWRRDHEKEARLLGKMKPVRQYKPGDEIEYLYHYSSGAEWLNGEFKRYDDDLCIVTKSDGYDFICRSEEVRMRQKAQILEDIKAGKEKLERDTGITPDTLIMGSKVKVFYDDFLKKIASEVGMTKEQIKAGPRQAECGLTLDGIDDYIVPFVDTTPAEATDPPFTLEIGKTYYAVQSKRTKMYLTKKYKWMISHVTQCLHITEYLARCASEHATDENGNPEPVEIVKIRLVCEGVVK
jgi:hypothetical protein